jgi:hypothetical protein
MHNKTLFKCLIDGYEWEAIPNNVIRRKNCCPKCNNSIPCNNNIIDEKIKNRNIKRLGNFIKNTHASKIEWECLIDGYKWTASVDNIFHGYGCPKCARKIPDKSNEILDGLIVNRNLKRLGNYVNDSTKIEFECLNDGNKWYVTPYNILRGRGCPLCSFGKSERNCLFLIKRICIYDYIEYHKLFYIEDRRFIPDFYLEINSQKIIIEYNGKQHYEPVCFNNISQEHAYSNFINQQIRDNKIRNFCLENKIHLLEIPYYWKEKDTISELQKINEKFHLKHCNTDCLSSSI